MKNKDKYPRILRYAEYLALILAIGSGIWMAVTASRLENPVGHPALIKGIIVTGFFALLYGAILVIREAKEFGWTQAIISIVSLIVVQILCSIFLRVIGL